MKKYNSANFLSFFFFIIVSSSLTMHGNVTEKEAFDFLHRHPMCRGLMARLEDRRSQVLGEVMSREKLLAWGQNLFKPMALTFAEQIIITSALASGFDAGLISHTAPVGTCRDNNFPQTKIIKECSKSISFSYYTHKHGETLFQHHAWMCGQISLYFAHRISMLMLGKISEMSSLQEVMRILPSMNLSNKDFVAFHNNIAHNIYEKKTLSSYDVNADLQQLLIPDLQTTGFQQVGIERPAFKVNQLVAGVKTLNLLEPRQPIGILTLMEKEVPRSCTLLVYQEKTVVNFTSIKRILKEILDQHKFVTIILRSEEWHWLSVTALRIQLASSKDLIFVIADPQGAHSAQSSKKTQKCLLALRNFFSYD